MDIATEVKALLEKDIKELANHPEMCALHPGIDFTRTRTLPLEKLLWFLTTLGAGTLHHELMEHFSYDPDVVPTPSALCQQKSKLRPEALRTLLRSFSSRQSIKEYKDGFALVAVDGSSFCFGPDKTDKATYHPGKEATSKGYNLVHAVTLFDVVGGIYLDAIIQNGREKDEFRALCDLADAWGKSQGPAYRAILLADRGFASYNVFAHLTEAHLLFAVRAKDQTVERMIRLSKKETLPDHMDRTLSLIFSRTDVPTKIAQPQRLKDYRKIYPKTSLDYLDDEHPEYEIVLRIVRFPIEGGFENIVCNLDDKTFGEQKIKEIYRMRWGVETSFRNLKENLGAKEVHSKRAWGVKQEIYACMVLFDFCAMVATRIEQLPAVAGKRGKKYAHKLNFATCIDVCCAFLKGRARGPDVEKIAAGSTSPIRPGRSFKRRCRRRYLPSYAYRPA